MLDEIFQEVKQLKLEGKVLEQEIMKRVRQYNYISAEIEEPLTKKILKAYAEFLK